MKRVEFERVTPESVGISSEDVLQLLDEIEAEENCEPHGLMIMRHGKVCVEGWWSPYAKNIPHEMFSMSKAYTAAGVGIAYTQRLLDINEPVISYFPEYENLCSDERTGKILVKHLLTMSSGKALKRTDAADWIPAFFSRKMEREPGSRFEYSSEDTHMCVALVERVTGRRFEDFLGEELFDKIGIDKSNLHWGHLLNGSVIGCGGLSATLEDNIRLLKLYLDDGVWEGERLLAHEYVRLATSSQIIPVRTTAMNSIRTPDPMVSEVRTIEDVESRRKLAPWWENGVEEGYGYQIWINNEGIGGSFEANGGLGQIAIAIPAKDLIISFFQASERNGIDEGKVKNIVSSRVKAMAKDTLLPENPLAYRKLKRRLRCLSLEKPVSVPYSPVMENFSGKRYVVQGKSSLTFRKPMWIHMVLCEPIVYMDGIKWFSFDFTGTGSCRMTFFEMDMVREIEIGTDGMSRMNIYGNDRLPGINRALFDGYWVDTKTFRVNARWIQTCYSIGLDFCFFENHVHIQLASIHGDLTEHPMRVTSYDAVYGD
ncbi:class C beta-lactamase-related serine hydrolase [bacterium 1xD8-48]|nr:class C beta-lactamase-related serine hydrolase [bacterium 1xD8-48]